MFPYVVLEEWLGVQFEPALPNHLADLNPEHAAELAAFIRLRASLPEALPQRPSRPGELRPSITTMRALDPFWGPSNLMDRLCTVLTYSHAATAFDPLSFTIEEWATAGDDVTKLPDLLARATELLVVLRPLVTSGALDLLPPVLTREYAPDIPPFEVHADLMDSYGQSGLSERIGAFNQQLEGSHLSGRFQGYKHLWEIYQDLTLVARYPSVLQPLFVAGFDAELAELLMSSRRGAQRHLEALAAFRFPAHTMSPAKVSELRDLDELHSWRQNLAVALSNIDLTRQAIAEAQDYVHLTLRPAAERIVKSFESRAWSEIRQTGVKRMVIGATAAAASTAAGGTATASIGSALGAAAADAVLSGVRARGRRTALDVPFLSMLPDDHPEDPVAIPKLGPLF